MQILSLSAYQLCFARKQPQHLTLPYVFTSIKKVFDERGPDWFLRKAGFSGNQTTQLLTRSVQEIYDAVILSRNVIIEGYSADGSILIETMMAETENVVLKRMQSVYPDDSNEYALLENFPVSGFRSDEPNTILGSRVGI